MLHKKKKNEEKMTDRPVSDSVKEDVEVVVDPDLSALKQKAESYDQLMDKHLRACAEFENARKRWDREKQEIYRLGNFILIKEVVVILDELEHALRIASEHGSDPEIVKGVEMTLKKFFSILTKQGLKPIDAKGKQFDPHVHEIVGQKQTDEYEEHVIIEEVQKGYFLEDKVLRTAKVILAVSPPADSKE